MAKPTKTTKKNKTQPKFIYLDNSDNQIKNKKELARLNSIGVPPRYHNVVLSDNANSHILAIGRDDRNRQQYIYNPKITKRNKALKYENVVALGRNIAKIRTDIRRILLALHKQPFNSWEQPRAMVAIIVHLLDCCNFRVGNIKYVAENGTYGCSTLCRKHIKLDSKTHTIHIKFVGKKNVINTCSITDTQLFGILKKLIANRNNFLFVTDSATGEPIGSDEIYSFLQSYDSQITPKMFRTWNANYHFIDKVRADIKNSTIPRDSRNKRAYINDCCLHVSSKLHNTASVSKENYISNILMEKFTRNNGLVNLLESPKYADLSTDAILLKLM